MASMRRIRLMGLFATVLIITMIYYRSSTKSPSDDFYTSTKSALAREHDTYKTHPLDDGAAVAAAMSESLKDAETVAKDAANKKAPKPAPVKGDGQKAIVDDTPSDRNVAGRKKYPIETNVAVPEASESPELLDATVELNDLLKKSPIIIFSKSYCPHSKRAKDILIDKWDIVPKPFVVELDLHPTGAFLQTKLGQMTGRKTVPNVLVYGKSIGGGDDIAELDSTSQLVPKLQGMIGKKLQKIVLRT